MTLPSLPERAADAHKGTLGRVLCVGGSRGMAGSIALAARAALASGAGLVTAAVPDRIVETVAGFHPAVMTRPLDCDAAGRLTLAAAEDAVEWADAGDAAVIGPGLSRADLAQSFAREFITRADVPLVIDADALHAVAADAGCLNGQPPRVLTPHPGEFAALSGASIEDVQSDRTAHAQRLAAAHSVVVVLKGAGTVVTDGRRTEVNETGNAGMATAGTGDVLTGMIAALLAAGMAAWDAARLAVHVHGLAGDDAAVRLSQTGMTSLDLLESLPTVWTDVGG